MKTHMMGVFGEERAKYVAGQLVLRSQWFQCEPLPDEQYEFTVKEEAGGILQQIVTAAYDHVLDAEYEARERIKHSQLGAGIIGPNLGISYEC